MSFNLVPAGNNIPNDVNVIIEIPAQSPPVKYEIDKDLDSVAVDRFTATPMFYPANYGYINKTLADDGDPIDCLVITPYPLIVGCVIRVRPIGILNMDDESGGDAKIVSVPISKLTPIYDKVTIIDDIPLIKQQIQHYFENYKSLEANKWVKVKGWQDADEARRQIVAAVNNYEKS